MRSKGSALICDSLGAPCLLPGVQKPWDLLRRVSRTLAQEVARLSHVTDPVVDLLPLPPGQHRRMLGRREMTQRMRGYWVNRVTVMF